ncbi:hypothetical protein BJV77DRAFT_962158 [Russula vinacea]|nr:hypothetical protein BJV77DRAFT_962158 [Russula vinacea]
MSPPDYPMGTNRQNEVNAAKRIKEKQDAEERALNETGQEKKGKEKADKRTLNETPTNATKDATTQKHPRRRRKPAKISLRPRRSFEVDGKFWWSHYDYQEQWTAAPRRSHLNSQYGPGLALPNLGKFLRLQIESFPGIGYTSQSGFFGLIFP